MDILLSSVEYSTFVQLMKLMRPVALHKLQMQEADAKGSSGGADVKSPAKASKEEGYGDDYHVAEAKREASFTGDSKSEKMNK